MELKKCTKCEFEGDLSFFQIHKSGIHKGKYQAACKKCKAKMLVVYRKNKKVKEFDPELKKKCSRCNEEKVIGLFNFSKLGKYSVSSKCKLCFSLYHTGMMNTNQAYRISRSEYRYKNKEVLLGKKRDYYKNNKDKFRVSAKSIYDKKYNIDKMYTFKQRLKCRMRLAFYKKRWIKGGGSEILLGSTYEIVMSHIEKQFTEGMNWDNHGRGNDKWHIDHIMPLASAKNEEELIKLCHYTNLQPLWAIDNLIKSDKIIDKV